MSDATATRTATGVVTELGVVGRLALLPFVLGLVAFALAWATVFQWVDLTTSLLGTDLATLVGAGHVLVGLSLMLLVALSRTDLVDTTPRPGVGSFVAAIYGLVAFCTAGLFLSQTVGYGQVGWVLGSLVFGGAVTVASLVVPEDVGVGVPVGAFELGAGTVILTGAIEPAWTWSPQGFSATFVGPIAISAFGVLGGLLTVWAAGTAHRGFGPRGRELGVHTLITVNAVALLAVLALLIAYVVQKGLDPMLHGATLWPPSVPFVTNGFGLMFETNGIFPAIVGTVWLVVGAVLFSVPLGVGAAIFLTEYADQGRFTAVTEIATNGLWSTPSIVYGLFGYAFLVPRISGNSSLLAGQLVLGAMLLPLVLITSRESLMNVPDEYRDASAALGVSKWQTIRSVVLPAALPGVLTGVILGVGRIAGETAPILLVLVREPFLAEGPHVLASFQFQAAPPFVVNTALTQPATALPYQLFAVITAGVSAPESFGWATALVLLLVVLSFYAVGVLTRVYFRRKLHQ